ncbi:MAG: DHH family phosphoesterase [Clostridia bacterium]|nr:DHH family phosphoesterase [Clostridia bacterium]
MQNKKFDKLTRMGEIPSRIYIILGLILMGINVILCVFVPSINPAICGALFIALYGISSLVIYFVFHHKLNIFRNEKYASDEHAGSVIYAFRNDITLPYAVINDDGKIITSNQAFSEALGTKETIFKANISQLCGINLPELLKIANENKALDEDEESEGRRDVSLQNLHRAEMTEFGGRKYRMECHELSSKGKSYHMIVFYDITELSEVSLLYKNSFVATGYIVVDNLEEIAQYVKVNYQDETRRVHKTLKDWATKMGGILCEYENNKFLLLFTHEMLSECIKNKFSILNEIRKIEIEEAHVQLTVSMGISTVGEALNERERNAMIALDMALQRGGDQVALKNAQGTFYFGAKTKAVQKRTRGQAKIICAKLFSLIEGASNILVMGHKNPDFDCIGACIGITTLIRNVYSDIDIKIVTDINNDNFKACTSRLIELAEYKDTFVDGVSALEYNNFGTLLIIVDANNLKILESPDLARSTFNKVIIDHHIKKEEFEEEPMLAYIDPSASSTCELISEMLEESLSADTTFKEEASIMMSGIMLDTNNFTRTVGMRTFAAALYLKNAGADVEHARTFFEEGFDDYLSVSQFGSAAKIYRDKIAITAVEDSGSSNPRVLAAKAADKLLTIKNISAAFALILIGTTVNISARSDGSINVQLILEQLGGGGHFDMAGAALADSTLAEAEAKLTDAIDAYYENLAAEKRAELESQQ